MNMLKTLGLVGVLLLGCSSCGGSAVSRRSAQPPPTSSAPRAKDSESVALLRAPKSVLPIRMATEKAPPWCEKDDDFWARDELGDRGRWGIIVLTRMMVAALSGDERYLGLPELATVREAIDAGEGPAYIVVSGNSQESAPGIRVTADPFEVARYAYDEHRDVLVFELKPERFYAGPKQGSSTRLRYSWRVVKGEKQDPSRLKIWSFGGSTTLCLVEDENGWVIHRVGSLIQS